MGRSTHSVLSTYLWRQSVPRRNFTAFGVETRVTTSLRDTLQQALGDTYQLERELGGGAMSRVFLATDAALSRRVVVKVIAPELAAGVNVERFKREIQLAARLQHP